MSFNSLLCHSAQILQATRTNIDGRVTETWTTLGVIACRFTNPSTSTVELVKGAGAEEIDATVFAGPELYTLTSSSIKPVRLVTENPGIAGTYELVRPIRLFCRKTVEIHHCECYVRKVQT